MKNQFLRTQKTKILDFQNKPIVLKGVNLGGWLMMEGYILHSLNIPEQEFKKNFSRKLGKTALINFEKSFRSSFIQEKDIQNIARLGMNCIRVPFHYRLIESSPFRYSKQGVRYLDQIIELASKYKIFVILDLHAAPGCQNHDWHSDSFGKADLWKSKNFQERTFSLWEFLADRYKDCSFVAGYDVLNESVLGSDKMLNRFYKILIKRIREIDKNHILFIEGNKWATDIDCLDQFQDDNLALSIHYYQPIDFVFNFVPFLSYPSKCKNGVCNKSVIKKSIEYYAKIARKRSIPVFVGEFGVNYRENRYGEVNWLKDVLECFEQFDFHWTYWTYKAIKNASFPDGVFSYYNNVPWVNRQGVKTGWETYQDLWPKEKAKIIESWDTKNFRPNTKILSTFKNALR